MNSRPSRQTAARCRPWQAGVSAGVVVALMLLTSSAVHAVGTQTTAKSRQPPSKSRLAVKSRANQMAAGIRAAQAALSPEELAIAQRVEVGRIPCELGEFVTVQADLHTPGQFEISGKKFKFRMVPVLSSTGAIRLEDAAGGGVWLQLSNKSMLMNHKTGSRMADACMSPKQQAVADAMLHSPPPNLLEPLPVAQSAAPDPALPLPLAVDLAR